MATPGPLGPNLQGMDSLTAAMKTNIIPDQEYLLQVAFIMIIFTVTLHSIDPGIELKSFLIECRSFYILHRAQFWTLMWRI